MLISQRNKELFDARNAGLSFTELGRLHGISRGRAEQIYARTQKVLQRQQRVALNGDSVDTSSMSVRAVNCLTNAGLGKATREQLRAWVGGSFGHQLIKLRNVGRKTAAEIRSWAQIDEDSDTP